MQLEEYSLALGQIVLNLQSLECALRLFLRNHETSSTTATHQSSRAPLRTGQLVSEDAFTNYDTLGQLIDKFNVIVALVDSSLMLDKVVVELRDALAHGRIWADAPYPPMQLVKFSKPDKTTGTVSVLRAEILNEIWFSTARKQTFHAVETVARAGQATQKPEWWTIV